MVYNVKMTSCCRHGVALVSVQLYNVTILLGRRRYSDYKSNQISCFTDTFICLLIFYGKTMRSLRQSMYICLSLQRFTGAFFKLFLLSLFVSFLLVIDCIFAIQNSVAVICWGKLTSLLFACLSCFVLHADYFSSLLDTNDCRVKCHFFNILLLYLESKLDFCYAIFGH